MVMRNVSMKNINGYSVGFDQGESVTSDLTSTYKPIIAPGEDFNLRIPATSAVIIKHVVFDDNSFDGDSECPLSCKTDVWAYKNNYETSSVS